MVRGRRTLSGREALGSIEAALEELRHEEETLAARQKRISERLMEIRNDQAQAFRELARFHLDRIDDDDVLEVLDRVGADAGTILDQRSAAFARIEEHVRAFERKVADLHARRAAERNAVDAASARLDEAEAQLQKKLAATASHKSALKAVETARQVAEEARRKMELAEADRAEKAEPYENERLFMYLWQRGYGTSRYRAWPLVRLLDGWVARLCGYHRARPNYALLIELPVRLKEHADRMQARIDEVVDRLAALEREAREATDIPLLEAVLAERRNAIAALDDEIAVAEKELQAVRSRRGAFVRGEDAHFRRATDRLVEALGRSSLAALHREALSTSSPEDERIVERLQQLDQALKEAEKDDRHVRDLLRSAERRRAELEDVRIEFRRRRYDDYGSEFTDRSMFSTILEELVRGAITGAAYWERMQRYRRYRPRRSRPDFGSGGLGRRGPLSFPDFPEGRRRKFDIELDDVFEDIFDTVRDGFKTGGRF